MVLQSIRKYLYDRRKGLLSVSAVVGGVYLVGQYALKRLEEARDTLVQDRASKDNLRQRFLRNQEDCVFTSQALVPTLGNQILEELDVEGITLELQQHGSRAKAHNDLASTTSSLAETVVYATTEAVPQPDPNIAVPPPYMPEGTLDDATSPPAEGVPLSESSQSWVEEFASSQASADVLLPPGHINDGSPAGSYAGASDLISFPGTASEQEGMTDSFYSQSSFGIPSEVVQDSLLLQEDHFRRSPAPSPPPRPVKSKAQLWKDLRTSAFTRTITLIYALTLLALQTHIQLNILASHKYVQSIFDMEDEEKESEIWSGGLSGAMSQLFLSEAGSDGRRSEFPRITDLTEQKYLTMNWWLLNVGWKNILERVRVAVAEVFDAVPLKSQLTSSDLKSHIDAVRRLVEVGDGRNAPVEDELSLAEQERLQGVASDHHAPEGRSPQKMDFLPILLPLSQTAEQHVLLSGGLPPDATFASMSSAQDNDVFRSLMDETKIIVHSKDFEVVLDAALEWSVNLFIEGMEREVFRTDEDEAASVMASAQIEEVEEAKLRLAAILPGVANWSHLAVNGLPNELIEGISRMQEVAAFSAIIFASYEKRFNQ